LPAHADTELTNSVLVEGTIEPSTRSVPFGGEDADAAVGGYPATNHFMVPFSAAPPLNWQLT
jgi:hypothetical protein